MRNITNWQVYAATAQPSLMFGRGYTGHEHLNQFGIINMNARLYDPVLITQFEYDAINQLVKVTDAKDKTTESIYDKAGRRTQVTHPASGTTTFKYDAAGNLTEKLTANLKNAGAQPIKYQYDFNRLKEINYPFHPENDVKYTYGADTEDNRSKNRVGRLVTLSDGSGAQQFTYGKQGEVTEVRRTLVIPNQAVATYVTKTAYDSWNRLQKMTYPDGEEVKYTYNTGGLLTGVASTSNVYVADVKYDKFEQRTQLTYGNGAVTNYTYNDSTRNLQNLGVLSTKIDKQLMANTYKFDRVGNIVNIQNNATTANNMGGVMIHNYQYDNLYRLKHADGNFTGANAKTAKYALEMGYDNMHNIISKSQHIEQVGVQFDGTLKAGYDLNYTINAGNCQQISNIAENSYRTEGTGANALETKENQFSYDTNGNLLSINTGTKQGDKLKVTNTRKLLWDEENHLLASCDNGYLTSYYYDAAGERTVKMSGDAEGVFVNGLLSGGRTGTANFTAYLSPYLNVRNGGEYTKHIYMGSQRITSKVSDSGIFKPENNPVKDTLQGKYAAQTAALKMRYDSLGVQYKGVEKSGSIVSSSSSGLSASYFYHSDHLGSSSLITDLSGEIVQHVEYVPFGGTFIDERRSLSSWHTPFLFSGKERDEETGLLYVSQRYQDEKYGIWYSVDQLAEKYPNISSYVYCANNPVKYVDPDGRVLKLAGNRQERITSLTYLQKLSNDKLGVRQDGTVLILEKGTMNTDKQLSSGTGLVADIIANDNTMTMGIGDTESKNYEINSNDANASNGVGTDVSVNFDISSDPNILTEDPKTGNSSPKKRPDEIGLAHELIHGLRGMVGKQRQRKDIMNHYFLDKNGSIKIRRHRREEFETVGVSGKNKYTENKIRQEQKLKKRGTY